MPHATNNKCLQRIEASEGKFRRLDPAKLAPIRLDTPLISITSSDYSLKFMPDIPAWLLLIIATRFKDSNFGDERILPTESLSWLDKQVDPV